MSLRMGLSIDRDPPHAAAVSTLILDTFTDTNGTALTAHTIAPTNTPATAWTVLSGAGAWNINGNAAQPNAITAGQYPAITCNPGVSDFTLSATLGVTNATNVYASLLFRVTDSANFWRLDCTHDDVGPPGTLMLYECTAGAFTLRASSNTPTFLNGNSYAMKVVCSGTSISAYYNGTLTLSYTSSTHETATQAGLEGNGDWDTSSSWDNFTVASP